jgi:glucokinase
MQPDDLTPLDIYEAANQGDQESRDILAWAGHKLGWGLGSAVNILDIRKIVVGGGVSAAGDFILEPARAALREVVMPGLSDGLELVRETLGNQVGMLGAAQLAFNHARSHQVT